LFKKNVQENVNNHVKGIAKIVGLNFGIGIVIVFITQLLQSNSEFIAVDETTVPTSAFSVFVNNAKVDLLYLVPYVGVLYYVVGFMYIYVIMGIYISAFGYGFTFSHLYHLPLEVFALTIPIYVGWKHKQLRWKKSLCFISVSIFLLFISAYIEFFLSKGVVK